MEELLVDLAISAAGGRRVRLLWKIWLFATKAFHMGGYSTAKGGKLPRGKLHPEWVEKGSKTVKKFHLFGREGTKVTVILKIL